MSQGQRFGDLTELRHDLHRIAEPSGEEARTAARITQELASTSPEQIFTNLGGHGVAAVFQADAPGPTVLLRAELDALPLPDRPDLPYASIRKDAAHKCGHDGHMAMLVGVARKLSSRKPARGRIVLLFQPAEETGAGAEKVLSDSRFESLRPDVALSLHNLPGEPLGRVVLREGVFASASMGLIVHLEGASSHAAEPHAGRSPVMAAAQLAEALSALPQQSTALHEAAQVTVVGIEVGGPAFGTSPGRGSVMATLRSHDEPVLERLANRSEILARGIATAHDLRHEFEHTERFPATRNDPRVARVVSKVAKSQSLEVEHRELPFAWSEDFGHFTASCPGTLFGLGAGEPTAALHHPDYDFPDSLLEIGVDLLAEAARELLQETD